MKSFIFLSFMMILSFGCEQESEEVIYSEKENKEYPYSTESEQAFTDQFWVGTYEGTMPHLPCKELNTQLTLSADFTFSKITHCASHNNGKISQTGILEWDEINDVITLKDSDTSQLRLYKGYIVYLNPQAKKEEHKTIRLNKID